MYQKKYRKHSKKWDIIPLLEPKEYKYIPDLLLAISTKRETSGTNLKHKLPRRTTHPSENYCSRATS